MATFETRTLTVTIDAPLQAVAEDLANPATHPAWATDFFASQATPLAGGEVRVDVPMMGGAARMMISADVDRGLIDIYIAPAEGPYGPPLPVRIIPNGDGVDVLWTLARLPGLPQRAWEAALASMEGELGRLRDRHQSRPR